MICPICKSEYHGRNKRACSMACYAKYKSHQKVCLACGKLFFSPPSAMTTTCSPECSTKNRKTLQCKGVYVGTLEKAHEAAVISPLTGRFETHMHAKSWIIQDPQGKQHECRNLKNWLREHENMLDGTVEQAWDGISKIKYSLQGKRRNPSMQWKGWRLIRWDE